MMHSLRSLVPVVTLLVICGCLAPAAIAQRSIVAINVTGNVRLAPQPVIAASGLRIGQTVTRAALDAAAQRLLDTGLFASVNYSYAPQTARGISGFAVTLHVAEEPASSAVALDFPGQDAEQLWQRLRSSAGLIDRQIPGNERASAYYQQALQALFRNSDHPLEVAVKTEADVITGKTVLVFRPAHLPRIVAVRFNGASALAPGVLAAHLVKVAVGQEYSEREFRRMLELNIRPLYEELGRLTVAFPHLETQLAAGSVTVTVEVREGPVWRLGKVDVTGDALPIAAMRKAANFATGVPANWKEFLASIDNMEKVLRRDGYIGASSDAVRSFRKDAPIVDVSVNVRKGRQFLFGALHIEGLDADARQRVARLWRLEAGAPMNQPYVHDFLESALPLLRGEVKSFGSALRIRPGTNIVDVTLKFQ